MRSFTVRPLTAGLIERAYPIVQWLVPGIGLDEWRAYAADADGDGRRGMTAILNEQDYVAGLFTFEVSRDLRDGEMLVVRHLVAVDLVTPEAVMAALLDAIDRQAEASGCRTVLVNLPNVFGRYGAVAEPLLARFGYRREAVQLRKCPQVGSGTVLSKTAATAAGPA